MVVMAATWQHHSQMLGLIAYRLFLLEDPFNPCFTVLAVILAHAGKWMGKNHVQFTMSFEICAQLTNKCRS